MANQFKNRLVGTIILVVLGVTVLPMLFDGKKKHYEDQLIAIPLVSTVDFLEENDVVMPVNQFFPAQQPEEIVAELNPQLPSLKENALTKPSYVVQLGALKNAAKVNEIVAKLRLSGYNAYTLPAIPLQGQITRIMVGPNVSKQKLQLTLPELNSLSGLDGQVKEYGVGF
ncbi:SPOR domain-containing protein [Candidatus Regiella insecticola]|uniref:Cell division protein DedD n=1 Tax=Candidatus Regiella insecticola TaxID=138073 RepID=A0A6L2ZN16_9ENTR|nr:SPOR domain-containing protein [Candidatus Regiella insecticola]GFN45588.1 cell division protein DedD [Candidatus Regiella insecticola]